MKRKNAVNNYLDGIYAVSLVDPNDEGSFSNNGCDCCANGLGNTVFEIQGLTDDAESNKHGIQKEPQLIKDIYICGGCLSFIYNGEGGNSEVEE